MRSIILVVLATFSLSATAESDHRDIQFQWPTSDMSKPIKLVVTHFVEDKSGNPGFVHIAMNKERKTTLQLRIFGTCYNEQSNPNPTFCKTEEIPEVCYYLEAVNGNQSVTQCFKNSNNDLERLLFALRSASKSCPVTIEIERLGNQIQLVKPSCEPLASAGSNTRAG